jgi:hypothetical protein
MESDRFDIFELHLNNELLWVATGNSLDDAKKIVEQKMSVGKVPSYLITCLGKNFQLGVSRGEADSKAATG